LLDTHIVKVRKNRVVDDDRIWQNENYGNKASQSATYGGETTQRYRTAKSLWETLPEERGVPNWACNWIIRSEWSMREMDCAPHENIPNDQTASFFLRCRPCIFAWGILSTCFLPRLETQDWWGLPYFSTSHQGCYTKVIGTPSHPVLRCQEGLCLSDSCWLW